ncbi:ribonuclease H-like domain-containing protein [Tanacetum coccineum]
MDQDFAHMVDASKVPMLKPGEFELWRMKIEQYIQMIDYALWEVIENGATLPKTAVVEGVEKVMPITSAEDKAQRRLEVKARSTLMMGIPNEHQLKFNSIKDAKLLLEAVEKRFGGNAATKKTQRNLLKQQYENFTAPSSEMLDQTFDRLQKLVSQLELLDEKLSQEDVNQKLLRSLSPEWNTHAVVWRNKADLDTMSMDDLYNNLKVYEPEVKGMSSSSSSTQNMAFVSSSNNNTNNTNEAVNTAHGVSTASTQVNAAYSTNIDNLSDAEGSLLLMAMRDIGFDKSKVECYNCHKRGHFTRECRASRNQDNKNKKSSRRSVPVETSTSTTMVSCDGLGGFDWSNQAKEGPNYASHRLTIFNSDFGVPPPYIGKFMPPIHVLSFTGLDEFVNKPVVENRKSDEDVCKKTVMPGIAKIEFVKPKQQEKTARKIVKQVEKHRQNIHSPRGNQRKWNNMMSQKLGNNFEMFNKACYVCGSFDHLQGNIVSVKVLITARPKAVVKAVKGNNVNDFKASACCVWKQRLSFRHVSKQNSDLSTYRSFIILMPKADPKSKGVIVSGCSKAHDSENTGLFIDFEEMRCEDMLILLGNTKEGKSQENVPLKLLKQQEDVKNLGDMNNPKGNSCIEGSKLDRGYAGRASTIQVIRSLDFSGFTKWKRAIGPYTPSTVIIVVVPVTDNSPVVPEQTTLETILNMSPRNKAHFESEKEAIHLILTGIGDEIYSTIDTCKTPHEMWEAIERLQQGESLNN